MSTKRKPRKIAVDFTEDQVTSLIAAVESEPILWNAALEEYRDKLKRDAAWSNISKCIFVNEIGPLDLN